MGNNQVKMKMIAKLFLCTNNKMKSLGPEKGERKSGEKGRERENEKIKANSNGSSVGVL